MDEQNADPTEFDVIVWGATGFTGKIVVEYLHQRYGNQTDQLTWAIAGRDAGKLQAVIEEVGCDKIPCLLADGSDFIGESAVGNDHIITAGTQFVFEAGNPDIVVESTAAHFGTPPLQDPAWCNFAP